MDLLDKYIFISDQTLMIKYFPSESKYFSLSLPVIRASLRVKFVKEGRYSSVNIVECDESKYIVTLTWRGHRQCYLIKYNDQGINISLMNN